MVLHLFKDVHLSYARNQQLWVWINDDHQSLLVKSIAPSSVNQSDGW